MQRKTIANKYIIMLLLLAGSLVIKSFCGFGWDDEGYYLSIAHRFSIGEIPLLDEWHPTQLSGILITPVYFLYKAVVGEEGIVLFFRLFYLALLVWKSIFAFYVIRKYTKKEWVGFFAAAFLLVYSKENMALFSYSDLAVSYFSLSMLLLLYNEMKEKKRCWIYWVSGVSYVFSVFANPYNVIVYIWILLLAAVAWKKTKDKRYLHACWHFTGGCCLIGIMFVGFVLGRGGLSSLLNSIPYFLNFPGKQAVRNVPLAIIKWFWYAAKSYGLIGIAVQIGVFVFALAESGLKKWKQGYKTILFSGECILAVLYVLVQYFCMDDKNVIGIAFIPLSVLGLLCFIMSEKKEWRVLGIFYIPGLLMSVAFQIASETGIFSMTTGFTVSAMASVIFIYGFLRENLQNRVCKAVYVLLGAILVFTWGVRVLYCRYNVYEQNYNCMIESGPYKGIITDLKQKEYYNETLCELALISEKTTKADSVLVLGNNMWMYLCLDRKIAAPTTWRMTVDNVCVQPYFATHPDKEPMFIYGNELCEEEFLENLVLNGIEYHKVYSGIGVIYGRR